MSDILIIDDDPGFVNFLKNHVNQSFPGLNVATCLDPVCGLSQINPDLKLLLLDLEMPTIDGEKVLTYAVAKGVSKSRIIILSGRDAGYLHRRFPMGSCLAVLNKHEVRQKAVLNMVLSALQEKYGNREQVF